MALIKKKFDIISNWFWLMWLILMLLINVACTNKCPSLAPFPPPPPALGRAQYHPWLQPAAAARLHPAHRSREHTLPMTPLEVYIVVGATPLPCTSWVSLSQLSPVPCPKWAAPAPTLLPPLL